LAVDAWRSPNGRKLFWLGVRARKIGSFFEPLLGGGTVKKELDELTMQELASLDFEADKKQDLTSDPLKKVQAALKRRTGVRAGQGWPPSHTQ
jgi:hypothetical protein